MKKLPSADDAEKAVIGTVIAAPNRAAALLNNLKASDFLSPVYAEIYTAIHSLTQRNKRTDRVAIQAELSKTGNQIALSQLSELEALADRAGWSQLCEHVAEAARLRQIVQVASELDSEARAGEDANRLVERAAERLTAIQRRKPESLVPIGDSIGRVLEDIEHRDGSQAKRGLLSGISALDDKLNGAYPGKLYVIAARPGVGKTALSSQWCLHSAMTQGASWLAINCEMTRAELAERALVHVAKADSHMVRTGVLSTKTLADLRISAKYIAKLPIYLDDDLSDIAAIVARCHEWRAKHPGPDGGIILDYLQLLDAPERDRRDLQLADITKRLKRLSKQLNVPVFLLSQLNRDSEKFDRAPRLGDLRESGSIEQDADVVILGHREDPNENSNGPVSVILNVAKHRGGPTGAIRAKFVGHRYSFEAAEDAELLQMPATGGPVITGDDGLPF